MKTLDELVARRKAIKANIAGAGAGVDTSGMENRLAGTKSKIQGMKGLFADPKRPGNYKSLPGGETRQGNIDDAYVEDQQGINRPNEQGPLGSRGYSYDENGKLVETTSLSPNQQTILGQQEGSDIGLGNIAAGQMGGVASSYANPFSLQGIGNDPRNVDFSADRRRIEDQIAGRFEELNADRFARERGNQDQSMADRGIDPMGKYAQQDRDSLVRQQEDARRGAQLGAIGMGGEEMQRSYAMSQDARGRSIDESLLQRDRPYQEMTNILGAQKGLLLPNFQARSNIDIPRIDAFGAAVGNVAQTKQNTWQGGQNSQDRALQQQISNNSLAASGAGDWQAKLQAQTQAQKDLYDYQNGRPAKPSGPPTRSYTGGSWGGY